MPATMTAMTITISTVNVNGIRAAVKKGYYEWLASAEPDVVTLQETRANAGVAQDLLGDGWHVSHAEGSIKGRAGVTILTRNEPTLVVEGLGERFADQGRWIEAHLPIASDAAGGPAQLVVVSAYVHTGDEGDEARMEEKLAFMDAAIDRAAELHAAGNHVVVTGDFNVAHAEADIKNWRGNVKNAGFLPIERARLDRWIGDLGWVDVGRHLGGPGPGPYTWWTYRGQAFDTDAGWRIDFQVASPELGAQAVRCTVDRSVDYASRWSDHAPVTAVYEGLSIRS